MEEHRLIRFDWAVKSILRDKANFDILEGFLAAVLNEDIKILNILESESNQDRSTLGGAFKEFLTFLINATFSFGMQDVQTTLNGSQVALDIMRYAKYIFAFYFILLLWNMWLIHKQEN